MTNKNLEAYRKAVSEDPDEALKGLRTGTQELIKMSVKTKKEQESNLAPILSKVPMLSSIAFALMALNSTLSQLTIAVKWLPTLPSMSILLFLKEIVGFALVIPQGIKVLKKKPEGEPVFGFIINPFPSKTLPSVARSWLYGICCLSNLRIVVALAIAVKYGLSLPYDTTDYDLQKVGNLLVTIVDLVIKTKDESKAVNFWLFSGLLINIFFIILGINNHINHYHALSAWLLDLNEGKLSQEATELGLESLYKIQYGEKPEKPLNITDLKKEETTKELEKKKED